MQAGTLFLGVKNQRKIYVLFQAVINRLHQMVATLLLGLFLVGPLLGYKNAWLSCDQFAEPSDTKENHAKGQGR